MGHGHFQKGYAFWQTIFANRQGKMILFFDSYFSAIKNSVGTKMFRNLFLNVNGKKSDVLKNGDLSCAYFVSSILYLFGLIKEKHATVDGTLMDMEKSGWREIKKPEIGSVILWETQKKHEHLGFYLGEKSAISHRPEKRFPIKHHWTYGTDKNGNPKRKIIAFYWNKKLG
jgi:hypothetical protein